MSVSVCRRLNNENQIKSAPVVTNMMPRPPDRLPLVWLVGATLSLVCCLTAAAAAGRASRTEITSLFEAFVDEQVAAVSPLHLGLPVQMPSDGAISHQLDSLSERLLAVVEGPDGVIMRSSLIEALQLSRIASVARPVPSDNDRGHDQADIETRLKYARTYNWHRRHRSDARFVELRRALKELNENIKSAQLGHMLNAFDLREFGADLDGDAKQTGDSAQGAKAEAATNLRPDDKERLAEITRHVNETLMELPPDEELRFRMATVEAYGLEPNELACGGAESYAPGQMGSSDWRPRVKRHLISSFAVPVKVCKTIRSATRILMHLVDRAIELGVEIFERLSATSQFLESMPIIGQRVQEMRARAEPLIKIVEEIRHFHYLFKVRSCPKAMEGVDGADVKICGTDPLKKSHNSPKTNPSVNIGEKTGEIRHLINKKGGQALSRVATLLIRDLGLGEKFLKSPLFDEIVSRNAYALMVGLLAPKN